MDGLLSSISCGGLGSSAQLLIALSFRGFGAFDSAVKKLFSQI